MLKPPNLSQDAPWKQRFRASITTLIEIAVANPSRGLVCSNQSGLYQLYSWDLGNLEVEDMVAARNWLWQEGIADPECILVTGGSYGG
jgi:hypothetical protein